MHILAIGASRNIGYFATKTLLSKQTFLCKPTTHINFIICLEEGHSVTFLLRKPSVFDNDSEMQSFIKEGKAKIVQGDATNRSDIKGVIDSAVESGLDVILSSVGKYPAINS